jgi:putative transcriptional regulator
MSKKKAEPTFGELLIQGAREALAHKRGELTGVRVTYAKASARTVGVTPPPEYCDKDIRRVREELGLSQAVFADLIGASPSTVRAWERGARKPSDMARRLLALAEREPGVFEKDLVPSKETRRAERTATARKVLGTLSEKDARALEQSASLLRTNWR